MISTSAFISVRERARHLGCKMPEGLAILPENFTTVADRSEFVYPRDVFTIRKLWREAGVIETTLDEDMKKQREAVREGSEWIGPTLFVSASLISRQPAMVTLALNVIANYLTDFLKGIPQHHRVAELSVVIEQPDSSCKKLTYKGPPEGLAGAARLWQGALDHEKPR